MPTYTNLSILQGWFDVDSVQTATIDHIKVVVIKGWIYTTDHDGLDHFFAERHPVVISGHPEKAILDITRKLNDKSPRLTGIRLVELPGEVLDQSPILVSKGRPYVIAQGKLLAYEGQSCVDIKHISFLGLPWGALDTLEELKPVMDKDVQALVAKLSPLEKHQISQALGMAIRELVALRSS